MNYLLSTPEPRRLSSCAMLSCPVLSETKPPTYFPLRSCIKPSYLSSFHARLCFWSPICVSVIHLLCSCRVTCSTHYHFSSAMRYVKSTDLVLRRIPSFTSLSLRLMPSNDRSIILGITLSWFVALPLFQSHSSLLKIYKCQILFF